MDGAWFVQVQPLHRTFGRVRFRYRCRASGPLDAHSIEHEVGSLRGVLKARVNPAARSLAVEFEPAVTDPDSLAAAILALSPSGLPVAAANHRHSEAARLGAVAMSGATLLATRSLQPSLQAPIAFGAAVPLLGEAVDDFLEKGITSHVLEALAVGISIGRNDYLTANTTSFLLALGEYLEASIERRSDELLKHLLHPAGGEVWVEREGVETLIDAAEVQVGDCVIAATGMVIPVDGTVLGGEALVNEATMTGEGVPVVRRRGDRVLSATLVEEGRLRIYAERVGRQAAAARIADFVEQSLSVKSETQLEAARLADRLVPMVLGLAGATWLLSADWQRVAAVLQADYSCALKLATPVAFKAAMYRAGQSAILIKSAKALERLARADTFVLDKTGTLTTGVLKVTDSIAFSAAYTPEDLTNLAASVEEHYVHPVAEAVVAAAHRLEHHHHFDHQAVQFVVAHGVASTIDGRRIVVGSRHFIEDDEGISTAAHAEVIERLHREGKTLLYIGFGGELIGVLALTDSVRDNAADTVARLRELGVRRILMLTGDQPERAGALAAELGLDEFRAGLLPEQKAEVLRQLAAEGARIAFVGDGVNDAPALTGAHVGIAMHHGADIARLASDITLLEDDFSRVADALALALATRRLIDGNFKLTAGLNTTILGAAAFGLLTPVAASMLHNGSTLAILLRALAGAGLPRQKGPRTKRRVAKHSTTGH
ncbi:ATPase, P-type (transporting), HAD superfamily, subfamily IC/heavy metal translocating P-type ATPase [Azotobacter beijerinckii]|uniref:P-type Zn(2+) transporter n=1 Tax=Azotobacter beijerinckii TaxID=170623 RepID=A0A1H6RF76_9GAMM|nr:heavy metal translocating P-type ATPase [Azotobacter beijerinckii]SEI50470.1 ATPase, P-type (transporting), HAD superfamily, subfamily IC/heavy metal translocating P-type ATPase [Azotobacter beijerinckii]